MRFIFALFYCTFTSLLFSQDANLSIRQDLETSLSTLKQQENPANFLDSLYQKALRSIGEQDSTTAKILHKIGVEFYKEKKYADAIQTFEKTLRIRQQTLATNHPLIAKTYHVLGVCYKYSDQLDEASDLFKKAALQRRTNKDKALVKTYNELADVYELKGDFSQAIKYYEAALQVTTDDYKTNTTLLNIGILYNSMSKADSAIVYLDQSLSYFETEENDQYIDELIAIIYTNKGIAFDEKKDFEKAKINYQKALTIHQKWDDTSLIAKTLNVLAYTELQLKNKEEAKTLLDQSLALRQQLNKHARYHKSYALVYENIGDYFSQQQNYQEAARYHHLALRNVIPGFSSEEKIDINPDLNKSRLLGQKSEILIYLNSKAKALSNLYATDKNPLSQQAALNTFQVASNFIDQMRFDHSENESKLFWREKTRSFYEDAIKAAAQAKETEKVFEFLEKSKAALLRDALNNAEARQFIPDSLATKERTFQQKITALETTFFEKDGATTSQSELIKTKEAYKTFITTLEKNYPSYFKFKYDTKVLSTEDAQGLLDEQTTLLEYFVADNSIYVLKIMKGENPKIVQLQKPTNIEENIKQLKSIVSSAEQNNSHFSAFVQLSNQLYETLFEGIEIDTKKLLIVPDGVLNFIPFEILCTNKNENQPDYLLQKHTLSYAYSSTVLAQNKQNKASSNNQLLAVAPIVFKDQKLSKLPESKNEVDGILKNFKGKIISKDQATIEQFRQQASNYSMLHLSTHASAEETKDKKPWIAFFDDKMSLSEIYLLDLRAKLVVLSACETAKGDLMTGEGVMSLARGFTYAGVPSIITSLWKADDLVSKEIMLTFYEELKKGRSKDEALRIAKLQFLEQAAGTEKSLPYYWATFITIGDSTPIPSTSFSYIWLLAFLAVSLAGIYWWKKRAS